MRRRQDGGAVRDLVAAPHSKAVPGDPTRPCVPDSAAPSGAPSPPGGDSDGAFRTLAESVVDMGADAVVFGGGYGRAARLARALRSADYSGARLATQRALDARFLGSAGEAAEGWVFTTAFCDAPRETAAKSFVTAYRARFGTALPDMRPRPTTRRSSWPVP